jgi:CRP/FNR family transcriptional regulator, cyclic AMP receptor protein
MLIIKHKIKTTLPIIQIKADTIIFQEGWDDYKIFFILEGSVKIYNENDDQEIEVAVLKKHEFFGEIEMYCKHPRRNSARMLTDVKLVVIRNPLELEQFSNENRWLMGEIMHTMGERLAIANDVLIRQVASQITPVVEPVLELVKDNTIRRIIRH